jgi:hypothetical protein
METISPNEGGRKMQASMADIMMLDAGRNGSEVYQDTSAHVGSWRKMTALAASVATFVMGGSTYTGINIGAGCSVYGNITSITLASGTIALYK